MASRETSGGVTSAAVVVFAGSACVAFFGLALGAYLLFIRPLSAGRRALGPGGYAGVMLMLALPFCLLTAWGISTGVGLLRRKAWARVSVLAFSVLALLFVG